MNLLPRLPDDFFLACRKRGVSATRHALVVSVRTQSMWLFERVSAREGRGAFRHYRFRQRYLASTSRFGVGQKAGSNQTPLGLHRVAEKIGSGYPIGTVFRSRRTVGLTWQGFPDGPIVHRILWLEGLEPGLNRGGDVDSHARYIYIHGTNDELTLGRPASHGCIHLAAGDLMPLFDRLPVGTLIWIAAV